MPIKYRKDCKTCQLIKRDPAFKKRFYTSTYYNKQGTESMNQIARDLEPLISYSQVYNHARRHGDTYFRKRSDRDETIKEFHERERVKKDALKKLEKVAPEIIINKDLIDPNATLQVEQNWEDILDNMIKEGSKDLSQGHIKINATQLTTLLKIKADRENAKGAGKDNFLAVMAAMVAGNKATDGE